MITKRDAEMLKAFMTASWMGVVDQVQGEGGCETCGYGAPEYNHIELEGLHKLVDDFLISDDNKPTPADGVAGTPHALSPELAQLLDDMAALVAKVIEAPGARDLRRRIAVARGVPVNVKGPTP